LRERAAYSGLVRSLTAARALDECCIGLWFAA
jgi:hypothetical protein